MSTTFILGGARSGKSRYAEQLFAGSEGVTFIAPGPAPDGDDEWTQRIARHRERRPASWHTVETSHVTNAISQAGGPVLIDCLGTWLTRLIDDVDAWADPARASEHVRSRTAELLAVWKAVSNDLVAVSNEVGMAVVPATSSGRLFRDELGRLNAAFSAASDRVHLVVAGRVIDLSGWPLVGD